MKTHKSGTGPHAYSFVTSVVIGSRTLKNKYIYFFQNERDRDASFGYAKEGEPKATDWKKFKK